MIHDAKDIAKYVISKCTTENDPISDLQLQKILYFIQVNFYRQFNIPAFQNKIVAKQYGPVVLDVYQEYKNYGATPIVLLYSGIENIFPNQEKKVVDWVIEVCRKMNPWDLVSISHEQGGPWDQTPSEGEILPELIRDYALRGM
jgi:uncharacterized phage-associated protein